MKTTTKNSRALAREASSSFRPEPQATTRGMPPLPSRHENPADQQDPGTRGPPPVFLGNPQPDRYGELNLPLETG